MIRVRRPAVDGLFYPSDPRELAHTVDQMLAAVEPVDEPTPPVALIVPHAGYIYSGPIAATAYARLVRWRGEITRVVVAGPAHRVAVRGLAVSSADGFSTPLGVVPLDRDAITTLLAHPGVHVDDTAHAPEHSIEVHLPFLQRALGTGWSLVPVLAGSATADVVADAPRPAVGAAGHAGRHLDRPQPLPRRAHRPPARRGDRDLDRLGGLGTARQRRRVRRGAGARRARARPPQA